MGTGAITQYIDVAQIALYVFWIFFAGLIYYLHREDKREGYPLENDGPGRVRVEGFPATPKTKHFLWRDGTVIAEPNPAKKEPTYAGAPTGRYPGAPLEPIGDPMLAAIGPGAYANRADSPDLTFEGRLRIVPLRIAPDFEVSRHDRDPRGLPVVGGDGRVGGTVVEIWVDRSESVFRFMEIDVPAEVGSSRVMLPFNFSRIGAKRVVVRSILGHQFAKVPKLKNPDSITLLEEEKVMAYYGGGTLYATPQRQEPLL